MSCGEVGKTRHHCGKSSGGWLISIVAMARLHGQPLSPQCELDDHTAHPTLSLSLSRVLAELQGRGSGKRLRKAPTPLTPHLLISFERNFTLHSLSLRSVRHQFLL